MSLLVMPLGFTQVLFFRDYWHPQYFTGGGIMGVVGLEELFFSFLIGGIAGVIYEELFGKKYANRHLNGHPRWMLGVTLLAVLWMVAGNIILGFNTMYVTLAGLILASISILILRHDLFKDAFFSGLFTGALMFILYLPWIAIFPGVIQKWWLLKNLSGILLLGVPLEEIMFGFWWGFVAGPAYEFISGLRFKK